MIRKLYFGCALLLASCATTDLSEPADPEILEIGVAAAVDVPPVNPSVDRAVRQPFGGAGAPRPTTNALRVHILNIGAGSCQFVECPNSDDILIADCGSKRPSQQAMKEADIVSYLDAIEQSATRYIVTASHPHQDHINKLVPILQDRTIKSIWLGGKIGEYRGSFASLIKESDDLGIPTNHGWPGDFSNDARPVKGLACGAADTYILTVNSGRSTNANSLMLMMEYGDFSIVFTGDAEGVTERAALEAFGRRLRNVSVATSSHHGAKTHHSNHVTWVNTLSPDVVVYSSGTSYGHPNSEVASRYRSVVDEGLDSHDFWTAPNASTAYAEDDSTLGEYVTELNGQIVIETDGNSFEVSCSNDDTCF